MTNIVATRKATNFPALASRDADLSPWPIGMRTVQLQAAATLLIGDAVYIDSAGKAAKSATATDYKTALGIVVGGDSFSKVGEVSFASANNGQTAATAGQLVRVATVGSVVYAVAADAVVLGTRVGIGAVAGRVDDAATVNLFAVALGTAAANGDALKVYLGGVSTA